jgi:antirestriction protein ArdC
MLWGAALERGYDSPYWMTYNQAVEYGAHVRKGEKGSLVVYANTVTRTEHNDQTGEDTERNIPFLRGYTVFNTLQIEGLPERFHEPRATRAPMQRLAHADAYINNTGAAILTGGNRAYYNRTEDHIRIPLPENFTDVEHFYATALHELTHWTGHPSRLAREFGQKSWGDEGYAREELVAELSSAFLCADLGITPDVREDHAAYIGSWQKKLKNDPREIFRAAAHAQRAVDHLHSYQPQPELKPDEAAP